MPNGIIKESIARKLSLIGYKKVTFYSKPNASDSFKECLLDGAGIEVQIVGEREFVVKISDNRYFEILATDFWFSKQKVTEQRKLLEESLVKKMPLAWLVVTLYYSAFYSSVELARLCGYYNTYLKKEHCDKILLYSTGGDKLNSGNYIGQIEEGSSDYITLRFSAKKRSQPHDLAWNNIKDILSSIDVCDIPMTKKQVYDLLRTIVDSSHVLIPTPNSVRNDWNYALPNAYDDEFIEPYEDLKNTFYSTNSFDINQWPLIHDKYNKCKNGIFSVAYIELQFSLILADLEPRIYNFE
ncbi:hypothetical protein ACOCGX_001938 [Vibrio cholerae]|nr:hypothetical protein [Vibrio vulnificus]